MECQFRILTQNKEVFEKLKKCAVGWSNKGLIIIQKKCDYLEELKKFDVKILITPCEYPINRDCFYFDEEIKECNEKILKKFDMEKYEPIKWKTEEKQDLPF